MVNSAVHEQFSLYSQTLPFSVHTYTYPPHGELFPAHWHQQTEILAVTAGSMRVVCDNAVYTLDRGELLFINPYEAHFGQAGDDGVTYHCILAEASLRENDGAARIHNRLVDPEMLELVEHIRQEDEGQSTGSDLFIRAHLLLLFGRALRYHRAVEPQPTDTDGHISDIMQYINRHYAEPLSTRQLAAHFGFSLSYFCRYFKRVTGVTVLEYLGAVRLSRACELLQQTELSIAEIATRVGYGGVNYFVRQFREKTGTSPLRFRKQQP